MIAGSQSAQDLNSISFHSWDGQNALLLFPLGCYLLLVLRYAVERTLNAVGAQKVHHGQLIEKQEIVIVFVQWVSVEDYQHFTASS